MPRILHVMPMTTAWSVMVEGTTISADRPDRERAVRTAEQLAKADAGGQVIVYGHDGSVEASYQYEDDARHPSTGEA